MFEPRALSITQQTDRPKRTVWRLAGHERLVTPVGESPVRRRPPVGGWRLSCRCGWQGGTFASRMPAQQAYTGHLVTTRPICRRCGEPKQPREMSRASTHLCKPCRTASTKEWAAANPRAWERHQRAYHLKQAYGITPEAADAMLEAQGGVCGICGEPPNDSRGFRLHVDHCHKTGIVRGILCGPCNWGIGALRDDPELLRKAIAYLVALQEPVPTPDIWAAVRAQGVTV